MNSQMTECQAFARPDSWPSTVYSLQQHGISQSNVQAVHPPSTLQETMIMSTSMDPEHRLYMETYHFTTQSPVDISILNHALHSLAAKHSTLRSIICWNKDHPGPAVSLAVLDKEYMRCHARLCSPCTSLDAHDQHCRVKFCIHGRSNAPITAWDGEMPWRISVTPIPGTPHCRLTLSYHHAILDGTSVRQLLHWIREEMEQPGSVVESSDIMSMADDLAMWRSPEVRMRLCQQYESIQQAPVSLEEQITRQGTGVHVLSRQIPTIFDHRFNAAAMPAWLGRLALSLTLCAFQSTSESVFYETMSARRLLSSSSHPVLGPLLVTQPRVARFQADISLEHIAQTLRSSTDIPHGFTSGELLSFIPAFRHHLPVAFICQTDESYPSNGVGDWKFDNNRETMIDMPLILELMPQHQGSFVVHLHYHRDRVSDKTMSLFHGLVCEALGWLQTVHTRLADHTFHSALAQIRANNADVDHYLRSIELPVKEPHINGTHINGNVKAHLNGLKSHTPVQTNGTHQGSEKDESFDIDLFAIESSVMRHPDVQACGVIKGESRHGKTLLALLEISCSQDLDWEQIISDIRSNCVATLPSPMVPSHFIQVAGGISSTASGTLDWKQVACTPRTSNGTTDGEHSTTRQEASLQYWTSQLENSQPAELLHDRHPPSDPSGVALTQELSIPEDEYSALRGYCKSMRVPPATVLLACFRAAHFRMTQVNDSNIGIFLPNETPGSSVCIRLRLEETDTFEELVYHVQSNMEMASRHKGISLEKIASELGRPSENPLVRSIFAVHSQQRDELDRNHSTDARLTTYGLEFHLYEDHDSMRGSIQYSCDLYAATTIRVLRSVFLELLQRGLQKPQCSISTIPLTHGHNTLGDMGLLDVQPCVYPRDSSIIDIFQQQVASHPDTVAVKDASGQLTYAELDHESESLADWLRGHQLAPETTVAIFAARSCEAIVAIMGILKANLAYVPLDHQWPDSRIQTILSSLDVPRLLLLGANVRFPDISLDSLNITPIKQAVQLGSHFKSSPSNRQRPSPTSLAHILFTSGSTGQPKGVMIDHRAVVCRMLPSTHMCTGGTSKVISHMASLAFDAATWEIHAALLNGGTVVCIDSMKVLDYRALDRVFAREEVKLALITPALLKEYITACPTIISQLDSLVVGGDRADSQILFQARRLLGSGEFVHAYGPTENTCISTRYRLPIDEPAVNGVPIGRALPESGAYIMDSQQCLVPLGVLGELVVTGDGLARGYTDPERNRDRFIHINLEGRSVRAYRTGDRVRYRPGDGQIEFFGRMDNQVKVRGNRIELADIELALLNQEVVNEAVVVVQQDPADNNQQLVAFVTKSHTKCNQNDHGQQLRKTLRAQLPSYMVPTVIQVLDHMPINHNGKIDRRVLTQMEVTPVENESSSDSCPRTAVEEVVCQEFSRALGCTVRVTDNFYDSGGHSLMATRAVVQIAQRLDCQLSIRDLINCPTPESLAQHIAYSSSDAPAPAKLENLEIERLPSLQLEGWEEAACAMGLDVNDIQLAMPCSPFQQGVLSADAALGGKSGYCATIHLSIDSMLDIEAIRVAWQEMVAREEMLRTVFLPTVRVGPKQGIVGDAFIQVILRPDSAEAQRVSTIGNEPISNHVTTSDLGMGSVPVSMNFVSVAPSATPTLVLSIHHALYDGAYLSCIIDRLSEAYHRAHEPSTAIGTEHGDIPFSSFIRKLQDADLSQTASFWRSYLKDAPCASWPIARPLDVSNEGQQLPLVESIRWKGDALQLARKFHTTPAAIVRAAVALMTAVHGNNEDVLLGEVSTGRHQSTFVAGPCIATHPVRIPLARKGPEDQSPLSFEEIVRTTTAAYADTIPHQQLGLAAIRRETDHPAQMPFQVLYVYQQSSQESSPGAKSVPQLTFEIANSGRVDFPLVIEAFCDQTTGHIDFQCTYDPTALPPMDAHWVMQHLLQALQAMNTTDAAQPLPSLSNFLLDSEEKGTLQRFSNPGEGFNHDNPDTMKCAHQIIQHQARRTPEKIALQFEQTEFVTYRQLDVWSTDLSHAIRSALQEQVADKGAFDGQPLIPICFDKSIDMVVAILAVLKAGAAYVPLDIEHPTDRLTTVCQVVNARILIWDGVRGGPKLHTVCHQVGCSLRSINELRQIEHFPARKPVIASPNDLAYVLFTSGSTGTPKGVMVEHQNLSSFMQSCAGSNDCSWTSNRLALLAYTFDASLGDLFGTLGKGARLSFVRRETLIPDLSKHLDDLAVSHLSLTPTLGAVLFNQSHSDGAHIAHLRTLVFGGEPFRPQILDLLPQEMTVWNGYGPTEAAIEVTACMMQSPGASPVATDTFLSIGTPTNQNSIHLLRAGTDDQVPIGGIGELCISGPQVSRGYLNRPDLTSKQFVPDPFGGPGLMYRTGDLARWHGDGSLECLGRMDHQIKLHGLRIELGEITMAAESHPSVQECVVTKVQGNGSEALVAVVLVEAIAVLQNSISAAQVMECIKDKVPEYMVPAQVHIRTEPFPLTSNGKMDLRLITSISEEEYQRRLDDIAAKSTGITRATPHSVEAQIAKHWANMLGLEEDLIDITIPFSQLGGDSIRAITLLAALRRDGLPLHMSDLRLSATIKSQADKVREAALSRDESTRGRPAYFHIYTCENSTTTVVLVHPFLGQSKVLEPLVPFLEGQFNMVLVDDPFFGTPQCPESVTAWADVYLKDVVSHLPETHQLILGGYSFGGLIAIEMAMLWEKQRGSYPASLLLLDPGAYAPTDLSSATEDEKRQTAQAALSLLGIEQRAMASFEEHYRRHNQVLGKTRAPPVYDGRCLYLTLPERLGPDSIAEWWQNQCSQLTMHCIDCDDHYQLLQEPSLAQVGRLVQEHCCLSVKDI